MAWSDEAVSPIVGTLLVVAMTVVVAGGLFITVIGINEKGESAPLIVFRRDQVANEIEVVRVESGVDWTIHLRFEGTCVPDLRLNGNAMPSAPGTTVHPGDVLSGCSPGQDLLIVASRPNQLLLQVAF